MNAVRLWQYRPFTRDGDPVDVTTDIHVDFVPVRPGGHREPPHQLNIGGEDVPDRALELVGRNKDTYLTAIPYAKLNDRNEEKKNSLS